MASLSFNTFTFPRAEAAPLLAEVRGAGYTGVGLFSEHARQLVGTPSAVRRADLTPTGYFVSFLGPMDGQTVAALDEAFERCELLGIDSMAVIPTAAWRDLSDWPERFARVLEQWLERKPSQKQLLLEPLHPFQAQYGALCDLTTSLWLLNRLPQVTKLVLDLHHFADTEIYSLEPRWIDRIEIVHVSDTAGAIGIAPRLEPGAGVRDLKSLCRALCDKGFHGWWEIEIVDQATPADLGAYLRRCRSSMEGLL